MIHELSSAASIAAQEASLVAFWSAYGCAPGRELYADDGLVRITTNVPNPLLNGIFHNPTHTGRRRISHLVYPGLLCRAGSADAVVDRPEHAAGRSCRSTHERRLHTGGRSSNDGD